LAIKTTKVKAHQNEKMQLWKLFFLEKV